MFRRQASAVVVSSLVGALVGRFDARRLYNSTDEEDNDRMNHGLSGRAFIQEYCQRGGLSLEAQEYLELMVEVADKDPEDMTEEALEAEAAAAATADKDGPRTEFTPQEVEKIERELAQKFGPSGTLRMEDIQIKRLPPKPSA